MKKKIAAIVMVFAVAFAFMPLLGTANAASKKLIYVVSSTDFDFQSEVFEKMSHGKVKYNKKGLVTEFTAAKNKIEIKYDKKNKVKQLNITPYAVGEYKSTVKYTWKKGKLKKTVKTSKEETVTTKYSYKGKKIVKAVDKIVPKDSTYPVGKNVNTYKYKKNHISKVKSVTELATLSTLYKFDKKGNIKKMYSSVDGKDAGITTNKITYKKGKPVFVKSEYVVKEKEKVFVTKTKFKFKKIKVPKKYYKVIKEQQWKLINASDGNVDGVSFAW